MDFIVTMNSIFKKAYSFYLLGGACIWNICGFWYIGSESINLSMLSYSDSLYYPLIFFSH